MSWEFELVAGPYGGTTEGPVWDGRALLFTDIPNSRIMRYDHHTGECTEWSTGTEGTNGLNFSADGVLYGCSGGGRRILRFEADGSFSSLPTTLRSTARDAFGSPTLRGRFPRTSGNWTTPRCCGLTPTPVSKAAGRCNV